MTSCTQIGPGLRTPFILMMKYLPFPSAYSHVTTDPASQAKSEKELTTETAPKQSYPYARIPETDVRYPGQHGRRYRSLRSIHTLLGNL